MTDRSFPAGTYLAIGLMSGTSVDGIDAALAEFELPAPGEARMRLLAGRTYPLPEAVREAIFALFEDGAGSLERLALLDQELGVLFAEAALALLAEAGVEASRVAVIGSHGQTIRHVAGPPGSPRRGSLQIGSGAVIASLTGIPVASDFRVSDIALGGTGAPLVPFFDRLAASAFEKPVVFQNFGGIGNLCWIGRGGELLAFDTGPGNMIADRLAELASGGALRYDRDGELGARGRVDRPLLERWLRHPFLAARPPKSAGREEFGTRFFREELEPLLGRAVGAAAGAAVEPPQGAGSTAATTSGPGAPPLLDLLRTAEAFTAESAARAYRDFLPEMPRTVVVTGGGAHNPHVMGDLAALLPGVSVRSGDEVGISVDFKEAEAFALLGLCRLLGIPNTEPAATGAARAAVAGSLNLP